MRTFNRVKIIVAICVIVESVIRIDSAALAPEDLEHHQHHHGHSDEHEHDHHDSSAEFVEISIKSYGEDCAEVNSKCNSEEGLICYKDLSKCDCNKQIGLVYSHETGKCEQVPEPPPLTDSFNNLLDLDVDVTTSTPTASSTTQRVEDLEIEPIQILTDNHDLSNTVQTQTNPCEQVNCHKTFGHFSKCESTTGQCICHDTEDRNRSVVLVNGRCLIERKINDDCTSHDECSATIKGNAWCHMDVVTMKRFCQCEIFNYFDDELQECLPLASDGLFSPCKTTRQCTGFETGITGHGLGPNAVCSSTNGHCECLLGPNGQKGFLHENYCFYELKLGDACNLDQECEIALPGQDVHCNEESKTCVCKNGNKEKCPTLQSEELMSVGGRHINGSGESSTEGDGIIYQLKSAMGLDVPNFVFFMIIGAVVVLAVVIIAVFIFRKKHKYTVVRTHDTPDRRN